MKPLPQQIQHLIREAILAAQQDGTLPVFDLPEISVNPSKKADQGDYGSPVALALAKPAGKKPLDIADAIKLHFPQADFLQSVEVAPPGFVNFRLSENWVRQQVRTIIAAGETFGQQDIGHGKKAQVEFVSANPTGPLHIGRTRGAILGDTLANLLMECGWAVEREYYFNNAGAQMTLLGNSLKARYLQSLGQDAELPENGYQGDYLITVAEELKAEVGSAWIQADWKPFKEYAEARIFKMIETTLARVGIKFDHFFNEQFVYDDQSVWEVLEQLRAKGFIYEAVTREGAAEDELDKARKDNLTKPAVWFRSTQLGDKEDRVVVKSNGEPTYVLPDIAYHINKLGRGFERIIDVFGTDHIIEAQTVARGLQALGYDASKVDVVLHQFVTFGENKMSTRAGNYVTLDDLIDEVGRDVVRYFMLARSADSHLDFNFEKAKEQSNENPVYYIQNAHVRCCGIFRQVEQSGYPKNWDEGADLSLLGAGELAFIRKALELPEQLVFAYENLAPHQIAFWALDLARVFHPLYDDVRVLHSEVPEALARARLQFYRMARVVFARVLGIMGMTAPERM